MKEELRGVFFSLIASAVNDKVLDEEEKKKYDEGSLREMYSEAKKHDIAGMLVYALEKNGLMPTDEKARTVLQRESLSTTLRYEKLMYEYKRICELLEKEQIPFIPLKGSVLREHYPVPSLRTSCDIDILVKKDDLERARDAVCTVLEYVAKSQSTHDLSMFSPSGVHFELHFDLNEPTHEVYKTLDEVWERCSLAKDSKYRYEMDDELFYLYHVAHIAKHFFRGGCGIRPIADTLILSRLDGVNEEKRNALLENEGLLKFAHNLRFLAEIWFTGELHTEISAQMENYILYGGVYGNYENMISVRQAKSKNGHYGVSRIILPYNELKYQYRILQKHPILTPIMQLRRWFKLIFKGGVKRSAMQMSISNSISPEERKNTAKFLEKIGL